MQAVALSARNMLANALQVHRVQALGDYSLGLLPFFQSYGLMLLHLSIYQGAAKVILPSFEPESFLGVLEKYKVTFERRTHTEANSSRRATYLVSLLLVY
jgi:acyl-CoA synthetase (AMP-forming)/AMP-acid ligase II